MKRDNDYDENFASKKPKKGPDEPLSSIPNESETIMAQFVSTDNVTAGPRLVLPRNITAKDLQTLLNEHILKNEETMPYQFFLDEVEITENFSHILDSNNINTEDVVSVVYQPQALFRIRKVTRCVSSLPGHSEAILSVSFSPDGKQLVTGSGDHTVRLWDTLTSTPMKECAGHKGWVLCVSWAPDGKHFASGSMDKTVRVWDSEGQLVRICTSHKKYVTSISWEPYHKNPSCTKLVSGSKDFTAKVWDYKRRPPCCFTMGSHSMAVTCVKWGGEGFIYTASEDTTIGVWSADNGKLVRVLKAHAHWVNTLSLNTDYVLRTGPYDHTGLIPDTPEEVLNAALKRYQEVKGESCELLCSGSDDFTCYLWQPKLDKKPLERMTGHSRLINVVSFSPDGRLIASAAFDKNIRIWSKTGKYIATFRGHVQEVYQLAWSSDSRLLVSGSKDSTLKVWDIKNKVMAIELPGHADEVYSVDWSCDGKFVASGSKDRLLKLWRN